MQRTVRKILRAVADYDPDYYDMYADANEAFFATLYVERIRQHAAAAGILPPATLLEAGCQAGRLVIPFARLGFQVTGVDTSGYALRRVQEHAKAAGVGATFVRGDVMEVLRRDPQRRFDIVVCAEVLYLSPRYRDMLHALAGAVRPGGLLCVSHRPKFYYLLEAFRQCDLATAEAVLRRNEGPFRDSAYYNWQTEEELRALYGSLGLRWCASYPIDRFAWLSGLDPSKLTDGQREALRDLELRMPGDGAECSRYVLVVAQRPLD
ncbi:MAG: methyltransferase domain-containing protein [Candidatus Omnitrophica bacterium]|nr:methyltransferase domain-containing protein [Candidatus Omnitrophota bacterium]MBI3021899.1 methyltransferase domain-containing protein [Candidatus Omnitrophota bacterium]